MAAAGLRAPRAPSEPLEERQSEACPSGQSCRTRKQASFSEKLEVCFSPWSAVQHPEDGSRLRTISRVVTVLWVPGTQGPLDSRAR